MTATAPEAIDAVPAEPNAAAALDPDAGVDGVEPLEPAAQAEPVEPAAQAEPVEPVAPAEPVELAQPAEVIPSLEPAAQAEPVEPAAPAESATADTMRTPTTPTGEGHLMSLRNHWMMVSLLPLLVGVKSATHQVPHYRRVNHPIASHPSHLRPAVRLRSLSHPHARRPTQTKQRMIQTKQRMIQTGQTHRGSRRRVRIVLKSMLPMYRFVFNLEFRLQ